MFVGHYGVSFATKRLAPSVPLWVLFIAVQLVDVLWGVFVLLGIEKVRIVPGITATNPLDLYYMPYTHSLLGSVVWAAVAAMGYRFWRGKVLNGKAAVMVGAAVLSHWILDFLVHRPDLPLVGNAVKVGLGLWNIPAVAFLLEAGLLFAGIVFYVKGTVPRTAGGKYAIWLFGLAMLVVQGVAFFGAPPPSDVAAAATALASYVVLAAAAAWIAKKRSPKPPQPTRVQTGAASWSAAQQ